MGPPTTGAALELHKLGADPANPNCGLMVHEQYDPGVQSADTYDEWFCRGRTLTATAFIIFTQALVGTPNAPTYYFEAYVSARCTDGIGCTNPGVTSAFWHQEGAFDNAGGTVVNVGVPSFGAQGGSGTLCSDGNFCSMYNAQDDVSWTSSFVASGQNLRLTLSGPAPATTYWTAIVKVRKVVNP